MQYFSFMFKDHLRVNYLRNCLRFDIMIVFTEAMFLYSRTYKLHAIFQHHILKLQHHWLSGYYKHAKPRNSSWKPPEPWWIKINVDASFFQELGNVCYGGSGKDHDGTILFSASGGTEGALMLKLLRQLLACNPAWSPLSSLEMDLLLCTSTIPSFRLSKVNHRDKEIAHALAKLGHSVSCTVVMLNSVLTGWARL